MLVNFSTLCTHGKTHTLLQHSTALISGLFSIIIWHNVATPVTAMMVSLYQHWCGMPYHLYSSVLIYLIPTASISAVGPSYLFLQTATVSSQHTCIILLHQTDTALTTQQTVPVWYRQFWTVCRRQQSDTAMISYLYQAWRCNRL